MSKEILVLASLALVLAIIGVSSPSPTQVRPLPASAAAVCPADTSEGVYHIQGYDKDGEVVCSFTYYTECPYAAAHSATDYICLKLKAQHEPVQTEALQEWEGK